MSKDVKVIAHIRQNSTGIMRDYVSEGSVWLEEDGYNFFMWEEGNYSCNCNRALFWGDASDFDCGEGRYSVNIELDGKIIYREFGEEDGITNQ